jgi:hypothetical protein
LDRAVAEAAAAFRNVADQAIADLDYAINGDRGNWLPWVKLSCEPRHAAGDFIIVIVVIGGWIVIGVEVPASRGFDDLSGLHHQSGNARFGAAAPPSSVMNWRRVIRSPRRRARAFCRER